MLVAGVHPHEGERLESLAALEILDTPPEPLFDAVTAAARDLTGFGFSTISLIDADRLWSKARAGDLPPGDTPRGMAFCAHTILGDDALIIPDAAADPRFADNPLVIGPPHIRAYVGVPIGTRPGLPVGTLCVFDTAPRRLDDRTLQGLTHLARAVSAALAQRQETRGFERRGDSESRRADLILEAVPDGIQILGRDLRLAAVNGPVFEMIGMSREVVMAAPDPGLVIRRRMAELGAFGEGPVDQLVAAREAQMRAGQPFAYRRELKNGVWVECVGQPIRGGGTVVVYRNIREDVLAARHARELEHFNLLLRRAIDAAPFGVTIADARQRDAPLIFVNTAFLEQSGYAEAEAIGQNWRTLMRPEATQTDAERYQRLLREGGTLETEFRVHRKDGTPYWVDRRLATIANAVGTVEYLVGLQNDVSERRSLMAELAVARDDAEAASRAKSEFLANMSHEIRTPLNGVIGMTNLLLQTRLESEQQYFARTALHSAELLLTVINDILDVSKLESGRLEVETIDFDLGEVVEGAVEVVAPRAFEKGLEVVVDLPEGLRGIYRGDPTRLTQVLLNFLSNAVKFTEAGHVLVSVAEVAPGAETGAGSETETGTGAAGTRRLRFAVRDTGIGLDQTAIGRLFQKFTQADGSITRRFGGTGLGLAIAKQLVELMGGTIGVDSAPGQGATFWCALPLEPSATRPATDSEIAAALAGRRVLIVDDLPVNREILTRQLAAFGLDCEEAQDGFDALARAERAAAEGRPYDLAILDHMMPGMAGDELIRRLRRQAPATRLILASSAGSSIDPETVRATDAMMPKPIRRSIMLATIARVLAPPAGPQGNDAAPDPARPGGTGSTAGALQADIAGLRVLVVEDNPVNREIVARILSGAGATVIAAVDGLAALTTLADQGVDIVLMDVEMPRLDGLEATRRLRARPGPNAGVPVIALTAHALSTARERFIDAGMDDFIAKPFRPAELLSVVETWGRRMQAERIRTAAAGIDGQGALAASDAAAPTAAPRLLDDAMLGSLSPEVRADLIVMLEREADEQLALFDAAVAAADSEGARLAAHRLVGGFGALGALRLSALARRAEQAAAAGDADQARQARAEIARFLPPTRAALAARFPRSGTGPAR